MENLSCHFNKKNETQSRSILTQRHKEEKMQSRTGVETGDFNAKAEGGKGAENERNPCPVI
jgi:hypothetical protein